MGSTMPTCPNGHDVAKSVAFCHECGVRVVRRQPLGADAMRYISIAALVVIVLGTFAITWVLNEHDTAREAAGSEGSISICGRSPSQRPTTIALGCGGSADSLTGVTWSLWNDQRAIGTGIYSSGGRTIEADVVLSAATATPSGPQFTLLTVRPADGAPISEALGVYGPGSRATNAGARVPSGGVLCKRAGATRLGVVGKHTSCDFADRIRQSYLAAGGHGQQLTVTATSAVTHRTYRNIGCSAGTYVVCVGGEGDTARVFFGPFD